MVIDEDEVYLQDYFTLGGRMTIEIESKFIHLRKKYLLQFFFSWRFLQRFSTKNETF